MEAARRCTAGRRQSQRRYPALPLEIRGRAIVRGENRQRLHQRDEDRRAGRCRSRKSAARYSRIEWTYPEYRKRSAAKSLTGGCSSTITNATRWLIACLDFVRPATSPDVGIT